MKIQLRIRGENQSAYGNKGAGSYLISDMIVRLRDTQHGKDKKMTLPTHCSMKREYARPTDMA